MRGSRKQRRTAEALPALLLGMGIACSPTGELARSDRDVPDAAVNVAASIVPDECRGLAAPIQDACPVLVPTVALTEIPSGVRVQLDSPDDARAALSQLRCRIARAALPDAGHSAACAFDRTGISVRAASTADTIEILGADPGALAAIRAAALADLVSTRASQE